MQKKEILVSVICTAYNHEKYIKDALEGFVMQKTNFPFEVLIHDDASTDNTAAIIREYEERYPEIIKPIYQTENQYSKKVLITNSILLPMAQGKYVAFCEGDDFWTDEKKLQIQVDFLENNPEYIACAHNTTFHYCNENKNELMVLKNDEHDIEFEDVVWSMRNAYQTSALVVRKEYMFNMPDFYFTASKYGFGDFPRAIWFTIKGKVHFFPYNMSTYRYMSGTESWSASSNKNVEKILRQREGLIAMFEDVKKHVSDERKALLDVVILEQKFYSLDLKGRYGEMMKPPFVDLWKKQSLKYRTKIWIKKIFPWIYRRLKKLD